MKFNLTDIFLLAKFERNIVQMLLAFFFLQHPDSNELFEAQSIEDMPEEQLEEKRFDQTDEDAGG